MVNYRCQNCKYFDLEHCSLADLWNLNTTERESGYCRKHKPVIYQSNKAHGSFSLYYGGWPLVDINDFCGEFRQDEES